MYVCVYVCVCVCVCVCYECMCVLGMYLRVSSCSSFEAASASMDFIIANRESFVGVSRSTSSTSRRCSTYLSLSISI